MLEINKGITKAHTLYDIAKQYFILVKRTESSTNTATRLLDIKIRLKERLGSSERTGGPRGIRQGMRLEVWNFDICTALYRQVGENRFHYSEMKAQHKGGYQLGRLVLGEHMSGVGAVVDLKPVIPGEDYSS